MEITAVGVASVRLVFDAVVSPLGEVPPKYRVHFREASGLVPSRKVVVNASRPHDARQECTISGLRPCAHEFRVAPVWPSGAASRFSSWSKPVAPLAATDASSVERDGARPQAGGKVEESAGEGVDRTAQMRVVIAAPPTPTVEAADGDTLALTWKLPAVVPAGVTGVRVERERGGVVAVESDFSLEEAGCLVYAGRRATAFRFRLLWLSHSGTIVGDAGRWSTKAYTLVQPSPPTLLRADPRKLVVQWTYPREALAGVRHFEVMLVTPPTPAMPKEHRVPLRPTPPSSHAYFSVSRLEPDTAYKLCVRARLKDGDVTPFSADSEPMRTLPHASAVPIAGATEDSITLAWPIPQGGEDDILCYQVEYKSHGGQHSKVLRNVPVEHRQACVVNGLLPATRYMFRIRAVRADGADPWSNNWSRFYATVADTPSQKVDLLRQVSEESSASYASSRSRSSSRASTAEAECCIQ